MRLPAQREFAQEAQFEFSETSGEPVDMLFGFGRRSCCFVAQKHIELLTVFKLYKISINFS